MAGSAKGWRRWSNAEGAVISSYVFIIPGNYEMSESETYRICHLSHLWRAHRFGGEVKAHNTVGFHPTTVLASPGTGLSASK